MCVHVRECTVCVCVCVCVCDIQTFIMYVYVWCVHKCMSKCAYVSVCMYCVCCCCVHVLCFLLLCAMEFGESIRVRKNISQCPYNWNDYSELEELRFEPHPRVTQPLPPGSHAL